MSEWSMYDTLKANIIEASWRVSRENIEVDQVTTQLQAQVRVANLSRKHKNEMFIEIQIRGQAIRDPWCEVEPVYFSFCLTAHRIYLSSQQIHNTSNLPPILTRHQHCRTAVSSASSLYVPSRL